MSKQSLSYSDARPIRVLGPLVWRPVILKSGPEMEPSLLWVVAAVGQPDLVATIKAGLLTLEQYQSRNGLVPLNVNPDNGYISTENAGAIGCQFMVHPYPLPLLAANG